MGMGRVGSGMGMGMGRITMRITDSMCRTAMGTPPLMDDCRRKSAYKDEIFSESTACSTGWTKMNEGCVVMVI